MAWIKRNLYFVIGSLVAVGLMVVGILYLLNQINDENSVTEEIQKQYEELKHLAEAKPHPGNDKIDNIKAAKEQNDTLVDYIKKERNLFQHIDSIPNIPTNKLSNADFARELRNTVAQLRRSAQQQTVQLPQEYYFTFEAQKKSLVFEPGSLDRLASHLGEIKTICDVLFAAKINFLDSIQREIISTNQDNNTVDYLTQQKTASTPLADLTPYRVTFRCFSAELAHVLAGLGASPYGLLVESINVEPVNANNENAFGQPGNTPFPQPFTPPPTIGPAPLPPGRYPGFAPPSAAAPVPAAGTAVKPTTFLNEKPFKVTLLIEVVKPKPATK